VSNVVRTYPKHPPMVSMQGARPWNYQCTWLVECDGRMQGANVVEFGRLSANGIPIPAYGASLNMTVDGSVLVDNSVYALDFTTRMVGTSEHQSHFYEVDVTWREPNSLGGGGVGLRGEHPAAFAYRDQPTLRPPEVWVEFEALTLYEHRGRNLNTLSGRTAVNAPYTRNINTFGPITNANGQALPPQPKERTIAVLCSRSWVTAYTTAIALNETYEDTVNSDTFLGYAIHYVKFRRAETGLPEYYNGQRYYELTIKVDIGRGPWYHHIANESDYYYDALKGLVRIEDWDSQPIAGMMVPIQLDGTFAATPVFLDYLLHDPVSYAGLVQYFT
jgi:hypothetical protein